MTTTERDRRPSTPATDPATGDDLATTNLPLVGYLVSEILQRVPGHIRRDDLTSAGYLALVRAARAYDPERGVPFSRYAATRIRGALVDELRSHDWASRSVRARARQIDQAREQLSGDAGQRPSDDQVARHLGIGRDDVHAVAGDVHRAVLTSLQHLGESADVDALVPAHEPAPDEDILHRERLGYLTDSVAELPERLQRVIVGVFFEERPLAELAAELGVSESRVSQIRAEALQLLRDGMNSQLDPDLVATPDRVGGCVHRRREAYFAAVAARSDYRSRLATKLATESGPARLTEAVA
jgi:RNA polymerase sigma factor for flagellar operon FliA